MSGKFFPKLLKSNEAASVEEYLNGSDPRDYAIVYQENPLGYRVFTSWESFFAAKYEDKAHSHEVITDGPQKLRFDLDALAADLNRLIIVENPEIYVPECLRRHIKSPNAAFQHVCETLISAICDTYLYHFEEDPTICVCESPDPTGKKYSRHLILVGSGVSSSLQAREFYRQVISSIPAQYRKFIDGEVYKRTQNFRLVGCSKAGSNRTKVIVTPHKEADTLISRVDGVLPDIITGVTERNNETAIDAPGVMSVLKETELLDSHRFRDCKNGIYLFHRTQSSECDICKRVHDRDHTLMITTQRRADNFVDVYQKCRRKPDESIRLGAFITAVDDANDDVNDAQTKAKSRISRDIAAASDCLEDDLFSGCEGIVYDEPALRPFEQKETLVIHAAMKMGKTKALRKHLNDFYPTNALRPPVIRFISFRQTFANNIKENFGDFTLYSDVRADEPLSQARLIVQVESLHRLEIDTEPPDLLILDECESIIEQFDSGLLRRANVAIDKFIYLLRYSKRVICMDANITGRTERILRELRPKPIFYHRNAHKNATDQEVFITSDKYRWIALVDNSVANGERIAIPMTSLEEANALYRMLTKRYSESNIMLYSSETSQAIKKEHFSNVNKYWSQYDVVIYTPTVSAGVSFEVAHFDRVYGYFTDTSCNDTTCIQMLGRIRDVGGGQTVICISTIPGRDLPTSSDEIREQFYGRRQMLFVGTEFNGMYAEYNGVGEVVYHTTPYFHIWLENCRARNLSRNNFAQRIVAMLKGTGAKIDTVSDDMFRDFTEIDISTNSGAEKMLELRTDFTNDKKEAKNERNTAIAAAPDIDYDEAQTIISSIVHQREVPKESMDQYRKFKLRDIYNYHETIDNKFVDTYSEPAVSQQYKNLCAIGDCTDAELDEIQARERAVYQTNMAGEDAGSHSDIHRKYLYNKHRLAVKLLRVFGWNSLRETHSWVHMNTMLTRVEKDTSNYRTLVKSVMEEFELPKRSMATAGNVADALLYVTGRALRVMYDASIATSRADTQMKILQPSKLFTYNPKVLTMPVIRVVPPALDEYDVD